jgi:hypothetical protein
MAETITTEGLINRIIADNEAGAPGCCVYQVQPVKATKKKGFVSLTFVVNQADITVNDVMKGVTVFACIATNEYIRKQIRQSEDAADAQLTDGK